MRPAPAAAEGAAPHLSSRHLEISEALAVAASSLGIDEAAYLVGRTYAALLPDHYRAENGVYYTPPAIVDRLLDLVTIAGVDWRTCRVLDLACGGGAFLGPVARRMLQAAEPGARLGVARALPRRLAGYEIDAFAGWVSAVCLDATLHAELGRRMPPERAELITVGDSLTLPAVARFELVVGNPPYGRVTLPAELRRAYQRSLYGHANLYGLFLDVALRNAVVGGVVAYVTPTGFLAGEYFKNLRALLAREAPPVAFDLITERAGVFDGVLQETLLAVFERGARPSRVRIAFVDARQEDVLEVTSAGTVDLVPTKAPWVLPRSGGDLAFADRLRSMKHRLSDWGYGVSTGPLVWNRYKPQLCGKKVRGAVPLVWAESITTAGQFEFRADRRNHAPYFRLERGDEALVVRRPCVLLQRTTAKEQSRRLIAAELTREFLDAHGGAVTVENHLNMVVPITDTPLVDTTTLAAFLNSPAADRAFRCISGTVAVSAYELEAMPLPAPEALQGAVGLPQAEVDDLCWRLYGAAEGR